MSDETITAEDQNTSAEGEEVPALNLEDDEARLDSTARSTARSTLERLVASNQRKLPEVRRGGGGGEEQGSGP